MADCARVFGTRRGGWAWAEACTSNADLGLTRERRELWTDGERLLCDDELPAAVRACSCVEVGRRAAIAADNYSRPPQPHVSTRDHSGACSAVHPETRQPAALRRHCEQQQRRPAELRIRCEVECFAGVSGRITAAS